ncbi:hypothetical protein XA68_10562 [Ophiocordyceps unilateralis]|uniref:Uncharacterized protein n=1 Tax=Ophiocordyceps unilateralis TaxID=268505 RepID=A0A2A9P2Q0_OPHUN|nr:hypothetical protein XA68_10562 [Ophiocordyceps unilateralis]
MGNYLEESPNTLSPEAPTLPAFSPKGILKHRHPSKSRRLHDRRASLLTILKAEVENQIMLHEEWRVAIESIKVDVNIRSWSECEEWNMVEGEKKIVNFTLDIKAVTEGLGN